MAAIESGSVCLTPRSSFHEAEMKRECTEFIRRRLQKEDARFLDFTMELTVFRRVNVDFIYQAESSPGL